jgi:hypothetical protein
MRTNRVMSVALALVVATGLTAAAALSSGCASNLTISNVRVVSVTDSAAVIAWDSSRASSSQVSYGPTSSYGSASPVEIAQVTAHSVSLAALAPSTVYHYQVASRDADNHDAASADLTFTTATRPSWTAQPCVPSGSGTDYQVGPGAGQLASLDLVPWESLGPGDTVRIAYQAAPYKSKFMISGKGTAAAPIRICGIKGPNGERPIIDGKGATTRATIDYGNIVHQTRTLVLIKGASAAAWTYFPEYITIDGLEITGQYPDYTFTDTTGASHPYDAFGACIWIERGQHIVLRDNSIHDCTNGIFSKSTDDGDFAVTKDLLIEANDIRDAGVAGDDHEHGSYVQSVGVVYQFNHYGPQRANGGGSALKDRSVGSVVRYNFLEGCARSLDFVEAEDYPNTALADPRYRTTFAYGNLLRKSVGGIPVHYGGDHGGATPSDPWGEPIFRKGTLYFFNNTAIVDGDAYTMSFLQLSTTDEHAEVFNNVFYYSGNVQYKSLRAGQDVGASWVTGGVINLGVNWFNDGWVLNDPDHPVPGTVTGSANAITGAAAPFDLTTFVPPPGSSVIDRGQAPPSAAAAYPVEFEYTSDLKARARVTRGAALDLGAFEAAP